MILRHNYVYNIITSFCVVTNVEAISDEFTTNKSVIVFKTVEEVDIDEKIEAFKLILEKYSSDFMELGMEYIK